MIGAGVNIGAGTITCNYDGVNKSTTTIEDGAFIGSNTSLVAPVTIGKERDDRRGFGDRQRCARRRTHGRARAAGDDRRLAAAGQETEVIL